MVYGPTDKHSPSGNDQRSCNLMGFGSPFLQPDHDRQRPKRGCCGERLPGAQGKAKESNVAHRGSSKGNEEDSGGGECPRMSGLLREAGEGRRRSRSHSRHESSEQEEECQEDP